MNRRRLLAALGAAASAVACPLVAQNRGVPLVGILYGASSAEWPERFEAFRKGLAEAGYVEGKNVAVEVRLLEGRNEQAREAADDLVRKGAAVIVATGGPRIALAAKTATATTPIVVTFGGDPVRSGLVASLNRPGGNVTGVSILTVELAAKLLDVLRELFPKAGVVALLVNPDNPVADAYAGATADAARPLGLQVHILKASTAAAIDAAFARLSELRVEGLLVAADPFFEIRREQLIALAERHRMPTLYFVREFVALGGLASYGTSFNDAVRSVGVYTGRILKGAKPGELPVLEPTKFELVINLRTAKALGLTVPQSLLLRADEVIQ